MGSALNQRHVATPWDIANKEGRGLLVRPAALSCCHAQVLRASIHWGLLVHNRWKAVTWITRSSWDNSSQTVLGFCNACQVILNIACRVVVSSMSPQQMCTLDFAVQDQTF